MQNNKKQQQANQEYQTKPKPREKFKPSKCRELIQDVIAPRLKNQTYGPEVPAVSRELADTIRLKLKDCGFNRYKFMVHVLLGQQKGQGVRVGTKCFWDYDTDYCVSEQYVNDSVFCLVTVYAVYLY